MSASLFVRAAQFQDKLEQLVKNYDSTIKELEEGGNVVLWSMIDSLLLELQDAVNDLKADQISDLL